MAGSHEVRGSIPLGSTTFFEPLQQRLVFISGPISWGSNPRGETNTSWGIVSRLRFGMPRLSRYLIRGIPMCFAGNSGKTARIIPSC